MAMRKKTSVDIFIPIDMLRISTRKEQMEDKKRKRLIADIDPRLYDQMKIYAINRGMNFRQYVEVAIKMLIAHDNRVANEQTEK
jgi:hypothetical protein